MLQALRSDLAVYNGPFEPWVREHGPEYRGRMGLVLANPPYGARGVSVTEDPDREYREKAAYAYFLRRGLDLLAPNGLGVYLVPGGFLTGRGTASVALRENVLRRLHLSAAFRLPSRLFPGAELVTDLLFFRARGGALPAVDPSDQAVLDGHYFREFPDHEGRAGARRAAPPARPRRRTPPRRHATRRPRAAPLEAPRRSTSVSSQARAASDVTNADVTRGTARGPRR